MTALERKQQTEKLLMSMGIQTLGQLPLIEEENEVVIRLPKDVAKRIIVLTYLCYAAEVQESKNEVIEFLKSENLWESVSVEEKELFKKQLTAKEKINISWRSEAIWLLLWTISKVDKLDLPHTEVNISDILSRLPKLMNETKDFIDSARMRSTSEILDVSDLMYRVHWATRNSELNNLPMPAMNPSIVFERHYAINWVTNYAENWDDITTDT